MDNGKFVKVARDGVEMGEFMVESIPAFLASGQLLPTDFYWQPGMSGWAPLSQLPLPRPVPAAAPKDDGFPRVLWLVGGFFVPFLCAWRIIFDKSYGYSVRTKVLYSVWVFLIFCMVAGSMNSGAVSSASSRGSKVGYAEADQWFLKGIDYTIGKVVPKDPVTAVSWYKKAAYTGHQFALFVLANQYSAGNGVEKDRAEAYALHKLAIAGDSEKIRGFARANLDTLLQEMTTDEIAKGDRRIRELKRIIEDGDR